MPPYGGGGVATLGGCALGWGSFFYCTPYLPALDNHLGSVVYWIQVRAVSSSPPPIAPLQYFILPTT